MPRLLPVLVCLAAFGYAPKPQPVAVATPAPSPSPAKVTVEPAPVGLGRAPDVQLIPWAGAGSAGALLDVAAIGPGEAIAVGEPGVLHISGTKVTVAPLPDGIPTAVWVDGAAFAVVVGYGGIAYVRENGGAWKAVPTNTDADLHAVWGRKIGDVREVFAGGARGTLLRLVGASWERVPAAESVQISAFAGNSALVWALGETGTGAPGDGAILKYAGGPFGDACPELACGSAIYDGWAPVPNELWTAGARGEVARYAGLHAEAIATGAKEDLTGIWGTGVKDLFVIGDAGTCLHFDGAAWKPLACGELDLRAISGLPSGEAWIVAADGSIRRIPPPSSPPG